MVIKSISFSNTEILQSIMKLYCPEGFELDPTYSKGVYYKTGEVPNPKYKSDLVPQVEGVVGADCRDLPYADNSMESINFDPPFGTAVPNKSKDIKEYNQLFNRFSTFKNVSDCWNMYRDSLKEFYRILKPNGVLVFKCQDTVCSKKQYLSHLEVLNQAITIGFYPVDFFILLAKARMISPKHKNQQHARKFHSYFIVFKKENCPVQYEGLNQQKSIG